MSKEVRKCAVCGKKFTPKSANAAYCSDKCYKIAKAKRSKSRKAAIKDSLKDAKKIASKTVVKPSAKPAVKKPVKKVVKAVCKEKIAIPKNVAKITVKEISPDKMLAFAIVTFIKSLKELSK